MGNCCRRAMDAQLSHKEGVVLAQLPQELITLVLIRLPVKSLLRFRCVSKSFRAIIDSLYFLDSHLRRSAEDRSQLSLIFPYANRILTNYNSFKLHVADSDKSQLRISAEEEEYSHPLLNLQNNDQILETFNLARLHNSSGNNLKVYGHCNGVVLLLVNESRPALWNLSTHQYRILPCLPGLHDHNRMGLGYDSSQDEYKIVVIQKFEKEHQIWIFGFRSNSWRRVCNDFFKRASKLFLSPFGFFADGDLHWLYGNLSNQYLNIVAFDMSKETFSIETPPAYSNITYTLTNLNVLDGCLCFGVCTPEDEVLLYVRNKDGAEFTWSLLYSAMRNQLPPFLKIHYFFSAGVLGYSKEGDKITLDLGLNYMVSYEYEQKSFPPTEITRPIDFKFQKTTYVVQSLVSVGGIDP